VARTCPPRAPVDEVGLSARGVSWFLKDLEARLRRDLMKQVQWSCPDTTAGQASAQIARRVVRKSNPKHAKRRRGSMPV